MAELEQEYEVVRFNEDMKRPDIVKVGLRDIDTDYVSTLTIPKGDAAALKYGGYVRMHLTPLEVCDD